MSNELPEGWAQARLGAIVEAGMGETILANQLTPMGLPVYSAGQENAPWGFLENPRKPLGKGTVVVSARGSIGFPKIPQAERFASTQTTIALRFQDENLAAFSCLWLKTVNWNELTKGGAIPMLTVGDINELMLPLPPEAEQRRIVAKLEALLGRVDTCQRRLERIPTLLKRFRQSILAAACSGQLTIDWREQNPDATSVAFGAASNELPDSWRQLPLSEVVRVSSGEAFKKSEYSPSGVRLLQIANVSFGKIIWKQQNFLPASYLKSHSSLALKEGDILIALNRPLLNWRIKVARLTKADVPAILYQRVGRFSFTGGERGINANFLFLFLQSFRFIHELSERLRGTDQPYINPPEMLEILLSVPPLPEQQEIVRRVEALFALTDQIEARAMKAQTYANKLSSSLLAKAFRGELVPTEAKLARAEGRTYESASALLERIRADSPKCGTGRRLRRRSRGRTSST